MIQVAHASVWVDPFRLPGQNPTLGGACRHCSSFLLLLSLKFTVGTTLRPLSCSIDYATLGWIWIRTSKLSGAHTLHAHTPPRRNAAAPRVRRTLATLPRRERSGIRTGAGRLPRPGGTRGLRATLTRAAGGAGAAAEKKSVRWRAAAAALSALDRSGIYLGYSPLLIVAMDRGSGMDQWL